MSTTNLSDVDPEDLRESVRDYRNPATSEDERVSNTRRLRWPALLLSAIVLATTAGCTYSDTTPATPAPTVVNVAPSGDSGLSVLLTVVLAAAFLALVAAITFGAAWLSERGRRQAADSRARDAEDLVVGLTGLPLSRARLALARGADGEVRQVDLAGLPNRETWKALGP